MKGKLRGGVKEGYIIIATNALRLGINILNIHIVMYVKRVHKLKDYK
jgi:superfamily II DNA helicase RecQ